MASNPASHRTVEFIKPLDHIEFLVKCGRLNSYYAGTCFICLGPEPALVLIVHLLHYCVLKKRKTWDLGSFRFL